MEFARDAVTLARAHLKHARGRFVDQSQHDRPRKLDDFVHAIGSKDARNREERTKVNRCPIAQFHRKRREKRRQGRTRCVWIHFGGSDSAAGHESNQHHDAPAAETFRDDRLNLSFER